jgi:hypothetical protein
VTRSAFGLLPCQLLLGGLQQLVPLTMQVLGEIFHRMGHMRDFPSRISASDCVALPATLQPGLVVIAEPDSAFPRAGFYKDGVYYALNGCRGNLVNVRPHLPCRSADHAEQTVYTCVISKSRAETEGQAGCLAGALHAVCRPPGVGNADGPPEESRAGHFQLSGSHIADRGYALASIPSGLMHCEPCIAVPDACFYGRWGVWTHVPACLPICRPEAYCTNNCSEQRAAL